jgi:hypothetical protein
MLEEAEGILRRWAEVAERAWRAGADIAGALADAFAGELQGIDPEHRHKLETLNGIHSNAAGLRRWLETTKGHPNASPNSSWQPPVEPAANKRTQREDDRRG